MANAVVNRQVNVYINSGEAQKAYDVLIKKEKQLNDELAKTSDPKRIKALTAELDKLKDPIDRAGKKLKGDLNPTIRELTRSIIKMRQEFEATGDPKVLKKIHGLTDQLMKQKAVLNGLSEANNSLTSKGIFSGAFWGNLAAGGIQAIMSKISGFLFDSIEEALDADAAMTKLNATLDNLGRGDAFDRITKKADDLAKQFTYLDNDDIVGVFNKLIDYGRLTEGEMNKLLPVIIDFAAKSQISIDESADTIVKALEGNGKVLKQYGINIADAGSESERFNIIMGTLKEKVDGSAAAFQASAKGGIASARQELSNLKEDIGNDLIPILSTLLGWLSKAIKGLKGFFKEIKDGFRNAFSTRSIVNIAKDRAMEDMINEIEKTAQGVGTGLFDGLALNSKDKLGIADNESKKDAKVKKTKERIDLLAESFRKMFKVQEDGWKLILQLAKESDAQNDKDIEKLKEQLSFLDFYFKEIKKKIPSNGVIGNDPEERNRQFVNNRVAGIELQIMKSRGKAKLEAQLELLKEEERQELEQKGLTQNQIAKLEEEYRRKRHDAEVQYIKDIIDGATEYANQALNIFSTFSAAATNRENQELEADRLRNEQKKRNLESRLKAGLITQLQYSRELEKMDRDQAKKERKIKQEQFERDKVVAIAKIVIDSGTAIAATLAENGLPAAIPFLITQAAIIASQIALINSQKPKFAQGGKLEGRSHADGGNAVVDGHGRKIAEVEAGEAIVNKHTMSDGRSYTVTGTPNQIISRLNGLHGIDWASGARLVPGWRSYSPPGMNYGHMRKMYATGGTFDTATTAAVQENNNQAIDELRHAVYNLNMILANGINAYTILTEQEKTQTRLNSIRDDATMKG